MRLGRERGGAPALMLPIGGLKMDGGEIQLQVGVARREAAVGEARGYRRV